MSDGNNQPSSTRDSSQTANFVGSPESPLKILNYRDFERFSQQFPNLLNEEPIAVAVIVNLLRKSIAGSSLIHNLWDTGITEIRDLSDTPTGAYYRVIDMLNSFDDKHITTIPSTLNMPIQNTDIPNERMRMDTAEDEKLIMKLFETFKEEGYVGVLYDIVDLEKGNPTQNKAA